VINNVLVIAEQCLHSIKAFPASHVALTMSRHKNRVVLSWLLAFNRDREHWFNYIEVRGMFWRFWSWCQNL